MGGGERTLWAYSAVKSKSELLKVGIHSGGEDKDLKAKIYAARLVESTAEEKDKLKLEEEIHVVEESIRTNRIKDGSKKSFLVGVCIERYGNGG